MTNITDFLIVRKREDIGRFWDDIDIPEDVWDDSDTILITLEAFKPISRRFW